LGVGRSGGGSAAIVDSAIKTQIRNYETNRWLGGNPETGYLNCDAGATKTDILNLRRANIVGTSVFWSLCSGKRVAEESSKTRTVWWRENNRLRDMECGLRPG